MPPCQATDGGRRQSVDSIPLGWQVPQSAEVANVTGLGDVLQQFPPDGRQQFKLDVRGGDGEQAAQGVSMLEVMDAAECTVPQLAPIRALHRHKDGFITFSARSDDDFRNVIGIRCDELETYFPQFIEQLSKDSFVSINADYRLAKCGRIPNGARTKAFGRPKHSTDDLKYLCACYVDIDYYRINADFGTVLGQVVSYPDAGVIPPASIIVRSGRGMWLLWFLRDPKQPEQAERAWWEKVVLYAKIQRAIGERLSTLGADLQARDAARHIRVPGSLHTGSEKYVGWWIQGVGSSVPTYELAELAQFFGVQVRPLNPQVRRVFDEAGKEKNRSKRKGWEALNARRLRDFVNLMAMRGGGFNMGCRNRAAMLYAWLLRCNGWTRSDAAHEVTMMSADCHPRLTASECRDAAKTGFGRTLRKVADQSIANWLTVTPEESAQLEKIPAASKFGIPKQITAKPARGTAQQERHIAIREIVRELKDKVPPCREMVELLGRRGINAGHVTISQDYKRLELKTERTRQREGKIDAEQRQKPFPAMS